MCSQREESEYENATLEVEILIEVSLICLIKHPCPDYYLTTAIHSIQLYLYYRCGTVFGTEIQYNK